MTLETVTIATNSPESNQNHAQVPMASFFFFFFTTVPMASVLYNTAKVHFCHISQDAHCTDRTDLYHVKTLG